MTVSESGYWHNSKGSAHCLSRSARYAVPDCGVTSKTQRKSQAFGALYFHYCYLLGIFPKNQPKHNKRLHFLLREDLAKLDAISEETKLLVRNRIDTVEQLSSYKEGLEAKIESLTADRKALYRKQRTVSGKDR